MLKSVLLAGVLLLPRCDTSCGADFPPSGWLLLILTRYTCGGKRILLGHSAGAKLECRWSDGCGRLSNVGSSGEVKAGCGVRREGERFCGVVIVVVIVTAAAAKLEGRRRRLTIHGGAARAKLEHLFRLRFIAGGRGGGG